MINWILGEEATTKSTFFINFINAIPVTGIASFFIILYFIFS